MRININIEAINNILDCEYNKVVGNCENNEVVKLMKFTRRNLARDIITNNISDQLGFGGKETLGDVFYDFIVSDKNSNDMELVNKYLTCVKRVKCSLESAYLLKFISK